MIRIPKSGNFYFTLGFLTFLLVVLFMATNYGKKAALFPLAIGIPTLLLVIIELVRDQSSKLTRILETDLFKMKRLKVEEKEKMAADSQRLHKEFMAILMVTGFCIFVMVAGFLVAIPCFVFCYIIFVARESWWKALLLSVGTWIFVFLIFYVLMEIQFPWSYLF